MAPLTRSAFWRALALLLGAMSSLADAQVNPPAPPPTLEIIVKFTRDGDADRRIREILAQNPQQLTGLDEAVAHLQEMTGFALQPLRITSGKELLVAVPETTALESVRSWLASRPQVASVILVPLQEENPRLAKSMLAVHFHENSEEHRLMKAAHSGSDGARSVRALALEIGAGSGVPLLGSTRENGELILSVNRDALLKKIVGRLEALDEVDYAQANAGMQIMK